MRNMLRMNLLKIAALLCLAVLATPVGEAQAAQEVTIEVDVVSGKKGASGIDSSAKKHERLLGRLGGYGGWKLTKSFRLKVSEGQTGKQGVGKRGFSAKVLEVKSGTARVTFVVVDPAGENHKVTSKLSSGASTVITAESPDGKGVQVFIIRVRF